MEMSSERAYKTCNAERSKEIMEDLINRKPKWRRGAPDEKIEALVIFFLELPMLLRPVGKVKKGVRKDPFR